MKDLEVGDLSLTSRDTVLEIQAIRMKPAPQTVYNIHLDKNHTYFVTDSDVLVHNYDYATGRVEKGDDWAEIQRVIEEHEGVRYDIETLKQMNGMSTKKANYEKMKQAIYGIDPGYKKGDYPDPPEGMRVITPQQWENMSSQERAGFIHENVTSRHIELYTGTLNGVAGYGGSIDFGVMSEVWQRGIYKVSNDHILNSQGLGKLGAIDVSAGMTTSLFPKNQLEKISEMQIRSQTICFSGACRTRYKDTDQKIIGAGISA